MPEVSFHNPFAFLLFLLLPFMIWWYYEKIGHKRHTITFPALKALNHIPVTFRETLWNALPVLRFLILGLIILAIARPQTYSFHEDYSIEGIDIMLVNDISGSMLAEDLEPNRLEAAKAVAENFINGRPNDRIGLVAFAGSAFTQCPLTADHSVLRMLLSQIKSGMVDDGTAIGDGVSIAVDRLKESTAVSKVIILLTDGVNNSGYVDPIMSANIAAVYGIRIYVVGVGTRGRAPYPVLKNGRTSYDYMESHIDEPLMQEMAAKTGGKYFRAVDNVELKEIYAEIDNMEKTRMKVAHLSNMQDLWHYPVLFALLLLGLELFIRYTFLKLLP